MQQRGVPGVVTILKQCLQGVSIPEGAEVHVFDLTPNRFAEWSRAVWDRQLHNLKNPDACVEKFTYTGYFGRTTGSGHPTKGHDRTRDGGQRSCVGC